MKMRVDVLGDDSLELRKLSAIEVDVLLRMPDLLETDDARVRDRLLPSAYDDPDDDQQWREFVTPELEHLFATRSALVRKDLASLAIEPDGHGFRLTIPRRHRSAWEAALTGASHAIYLLADLKPGDTASEPGDLGDSERDLALFRLRVLGYVLSEILDLDGFA